MLMINFGISEIFAILNYPNLDHLQTWNFSFKVFVDISTLGYVRNYLNQNANVSINGSLDIYQILTISSVKFAHDQDK